METGIQISNSVQISTQLGGMLETFEAEARRRVQDIIDQEGEDTYTITEKRALVKLESLRIIGTMGLAEILLRGELIREIEREGLWSLHPSRYGSMEEAAAAQGISQSEYSNIRDMCEVVFPYLTEAGYNVPDLWEEIGKSKFRELTPVLKRAITNEESRSPRTEQTFQRMMDDIIATGIVAGDEPTEEDARTILIDQVIEAGTLLPVRELRQQIRPERTPSMVGYSIPYRNNSNILIFTLDVDQQELLNRRLTGYTDIMPISQLDMHHSTLVHDIVDYLRGS